MNYNISLTQGEDYSLSQTVTGSNGSAINFSGYSIRGKVRYSYGDYPTGVSGYYSDALLDLSPSWTSAVSGIVSVSLTPTQTASLPATVALYNIEAYTSGDASVINALKGNVNVAPQVSTS